MHVLARAAVLALALVFPAGDALAQAWPAKPLRLIVPFRPAIIWSAARRQTSCARISASR